MKSIKQPPMKQGSLDDFQTPGIACEPLIEFLDKNWIIWECSEGKGNITNFFKNKDFDIIGSDILTGNNFLEYSPDKFDCIITNPPFSKKQEFLERCYSFKKPFALLLPLTTFETYKRQKLFKENGIQVIFLNKRVRFETPNGNKGKNSSPWFSTAWFTWGLNLPRDLMFKNLNEDTLKGGNNNE